MVLIQVASLYILIIVDNVRDRGAVEGEADADTTRDRGAVEGVKSVSKYPSKHTVRQKVFPPRLPFCAHEGDV